MSHEDSSIYAIYNKDMTLILCAVCRSVIICFFLTDLGKKTMIAEGNEHSQYQ